MAEEISNRIRILSFLGIFFLGIFAWAQVTQGTPPKKKIKHLHSDVIKSTPERFEGNQFAYGNVGFEHERTKLYSDSAVYYMKENFFRAWSNVRIVNDTMNMRSDSLEYDGNLSIAKAFGNVHMKDPKSEMFADYVEYNRETEFIIASGNVVLVDPTQRVETPYLTYDRRTGIAYTDKGAIIRGSDGTVTHTQILQYDTRTKTIDFNQNTRIETKDYIIDSHKMRMNQQTGETEFLANSRVTSRENPRDNIYMPEGGGIFNRKTGEAFLNKRSIVYREGKELHGDKMYFNDKTGFGWARGNVLMDDPEEQRFIRGEYAEAHRDMDSAFVTGNAYAVKAFTEDSLYFHADTIMAVQRKDSTRVLKAYYNARFFKSNAQGKSDSVFYNETIGLLKSFRDPIMWSGDQQITGDTIYLYNNPQLEVLDSVRIFNNAFAVAKVDSLNDKEFNQVKGKFMTGYFLNNSLNLVEVHENAQSVTFVDDEDEETLEKERIGINLSDCGIIEAEINGKNVDVLSCRIQANSKLYPDSKLPETARYLKDFRWRGDERMLRWQDIFIKVPENLQIDISNTDTESVEAERIDLDKILEEEEKEQGINSSEETKENKE
ncbi:OstA-like protein [Moheibacter stercoris]|uniref:Lipopolysaccharide export system protein LptA n=1 Tax=Moheibacter stercoris TaxID=1628251 RepID=A0ABV2LU52_9FLAO